MPESPSPRVALLFATSGHSGVDRVVANLVREFGHYSLEFDLLTLRGHGPYIDDLPPNVRRIPLRAAHRNTALPALIVYLLRHRPQALYTASHRLNRTALLARRLTRPGMPVAIRMGMSISATLAEMKPSRARRLQHSMQRWYPQADAVVAPSEGVGHDLNTLAGVPAERLHVIPNPIVSTDLIDQAAAPLEDPWLQDSRTQKIPVVLGAGSLELRKDFASLIRAFAKLRQRRPLRLVILGEGRERTNLEQLARDLGVEQDLRLPGFQYNPYAWMARANAFALTSKREGSGAVLIEALACGTPCVATDCPSGPAEILDQGTLGPVVPIGDIEALAQALDTLLTTPPDPATLQAATLPFTAEASARAYLKALRLAP
ncbi:MULTISPECIES: glycosyltransferase [unclassified Thioalkalivibrio]|uniref:glycosyltransferase n=1 Tax=unclassified Thioalkalivibrio TaxID=2621013 RepID=UPI0003695DD4|nr:MULTISPECIES: glycosyltransferase [unclassified Thioalkalivibrio]